MLAKTAQAEEPVDRLCWIARLMTKAVLIVAGFHLHARGDWRRRRT